MSCVIYHIFHIKPFSYIHKYNSMYTHVQFGMYVHTHTYIHVYVNMYICVSVYIYMYVYTYRCIYVHKGLCRKGGLCYVPLVTATCYASLASYAFKSETQQLCCQYPYEVKPVSLPVVTLACRGYPNAKHRWRYVRGYVPQLCKFSKSRSSCSVVLSFLR